MRSRGGGSGALSNELSSQARGSQNYPLNPHRERGTAGRRKHFALPPLKSALARDGYLGPMVSLQLRGSRIHCHRSRARRSVTHYQALTRNDAASILATRENTARWVESGAQVALNSVTNSPGYMHARSVNGRGRKSSPYRTLSTAHEEPSASE